MTATNSTEPAKDGNGNAFNITFAAESVSGNKAQKTYIGEPVGETIITPAQDGTDGTGITAPTGAVGIRGWLSGIYKVLMNTLANAQGSTTSGQTGPLVQGSVTTSAPTYTTAQTSPLSLDTAGNLRVNVVAGCASGNVAQGSTTSGETGVMIQGAVTTAAPSYTAAQTSPISLTTAGAVRTDASATTQPVSVASLPLPSGAAQDGTDGTGITAPPGAVGIRGWLSGIFSKLTSLINALGTPMQATGGTVGLIAGTAAIGSIIGRTTMATATPVVTSNGAYAAGNEIGGLMTFPIGGAGSGTLLSVRVTSRSVLTTALKAYIFTTNPSNSTWTDKSAIAINAADIASLLAIVTLNAPDSGLGTHTLWNVGAIGEQFVAANLYVVLVVVSAATLTSASTSDITVQLGVSDD